MKKISLQKIPVLALCSCLAIVAIGFMKPAMELEDAEQAYYSQWWRWGYDDQPPLYTWLQIIVNKVFGVTKFSFSFLRGLLFALILLALYRLALAYGKERTKSTLTVLSLILVPTFIDFTFRRLSHTSLLCLAIVATYLVIYKLLEKKTTVQYVLLGAVIGIGVLTKYTYVLALGSFFLAVLFDNSLRGLLCNKRILWTLGIVLMCIAPHFYWLFDHSGYLLELKHSINLKTENSLGKGIPIISPIFSLILTLTKLLAPLLGAMVILALFRKVRFKRKRQMDWMVRLLWSQLVLLGIVFMIMDIQKVEPRWLLPLFLPFLVLLPQLMIVKKPIKWERYGFYAFLLILMIQFLRTPIERVLHIPSSVHFGFEAISDKLKEAYGKKRWYLPNVTYGGNIRLLNPKKEVFAMDDFSLPSLKQAREAGSVVIKNKKSPEAGQPQPLDSIIGFGKEREELFFYDY